MKRCQAPRGCAVVILLACALTARAEDAPEVVAPPTESPPAGDTAVGRDVPRRLPSIFTPPAAEQPSYRVAPAYPTTTPSPGQPIATAAVPPAAAGVLAYYENPTAAATVQQIPAAPPVTQPVRRVVYAPQRPFTGVEPAPTISPYLNLFRDDDEQGLPNYHAFVRPQLEQQRVNRQQRREVERLNRAVRTIEYQQPVAPATSSGLPPTGHRTRFFNTGGFYGQVQPRN